MAAVEFTVTREFSAPAELLWAELIDWKGHEDWVPATRVDVSSADPSEVGSTFVAWTGVRPLVLEDRMRVDECVWHEAERRGECVVAKLGPVLAGRAGFTVESVGSGSRLVWFEDVAIKWLPSRLGPPVGQLGAVGLSFAMRSLDRLLHQKSVGSSPTSTLGPTS